LEVGSLFGKGTKILAGVFFPWLLPGLSPTEVPKTRWPNFSGSWNQPGEARKRAMVFPRFPYSIFLEYFQGGYSGFHSNVKGTCSYNHGITLYPPKRATQRLFMDYWLRPILAFVIIQASSFSSI